MKLKKLLEFLSEYSVQSHGSKEVEITGITSDSRFVGPGNLFIARRGRTTDGSYYIHDAIQAGAAAILTDLYNPTLTQTQLIYPHPGALEGTLADGFYGHPSRKLLVVGITGTSGKTTCSYWARHLFEACGFPCGLMGTIERIIGKRRLPSSLTTADVTTNHKLLAEMVRQGCKAVVLEAASHGLDQGRLDQVKIDVGLFTNLTPEHLDYHKTMDSYAEAKAKLFERTAAAIYNIEDPWAEKILSLHQGKTLTYGWTDRADLWAEEIHQSQEGLSCSICEGAKSYRVTLPLLGRFNLLNVLGVIGLLRLQGTPMEALLPHLSTLPPIPGRLEKIPLAGSDFALFVDYAHKPDALAAALTALREHGWKRLLCVFGCGGDRDPHKRPLMGAVARELADEVILTSDNPRTEDPRAICEEIAKGAGEEAVIILDRRKALEYALERVEPGDALLVAGKGHEREQLFANKRLPFSDQQILMELAKERSAL